MSKLADRIEERIRAIRSTNPGYVSVRQETLGDILSRALLRKVAETAAEVAEASTQSPHSGGGAAL